MATARETILAGPFGDLNGLTGIVHVRTLFKNFCDYAKRFYTYSATKVEGSKGQELLEYPHGDLRVVDCGGLRHAFLLMAIENLGLRDETSGAAVSWSKGFATRQFSKCFDAKIHGNIRTATQNFRAISRCVFREHYFVKIGTRFYDPCMLATYETEEEVMSWKFKNACDPYDRILYGVEGDDSTLLIRIPDAAPQPHGFASSFLQIETKELDKAVYHKAFNTRFKPHWQMKTKSVNQLLQAAGIAATWPNIK